MKRTKKTNGARAASGGGSKAASRGAATTGSSAARGKSAPPSARTKATGPVSAPRPTGSATAERSKTAEAPQMALPSGTRKTKASSPPAPRVDATASSSSRTAGTGLQKAAPKDPARGRARASTPPSAEVVAQLRELDAHLDRLIDEGSRRDLASVAAAEIDEDEAIASTDIFGDSPVSLAPRSLVSNASPTIVTGDESAEEEAIASSDIFGDSPVSLSPTSMAAPTVVRPPTVSTMEEEGAIASSDIFGDSPVSLSPRQLGLEFLKAEVDDGSDEVATDEVEVAFVTQPRPETSKTSDDDAAVSTRRFPSTTPPSGVALEAELDDESNDDEQAGIPTPPPSAPPPSFRPNFGPSPDSRSRIPSAPESVLDTARELLSTDFYLRKWGRLAMRGRSEEVDDFGYDPTYDEKVRPMIDFLYATYFRVETSGIENVPNEGRCVLVANHSGTLPLDGLMIKAALRREHPEARPVRWLTEDFIYHFPYVGSLVNRLGAVRACQENAERLLAKEQVVAVFPEGVKGIGKLFAERYRLQRFGRGGFIKLCLRTKTPIVPVAVVGAEETNPMLFRVEYLSKLLGLPYLPVTPTFPLLGPAGLLPAPTKWTMQFGEPLDISAYGPEGADDEILVGKLAERVRASIQGMLDRAVGARKSVFFG